MKLSTAYAGAGLALLATLAGCAAMNEGSNAKSVKAQAVALMKAGFQTNGQAGLDRLEQDGVQALCDGRDEAAGSAAERAAYAKERAAFEQQELASVKFPADGKWLGSYAAGEKVAQTGVGLQWSDKPGAPAGGNCYACHQISKQEVSFGNIGPSLYQYGKLRGNSEEMMRYTWTRIYNPKAYNACSNMPRFGHKSILTEQQLKDVMALLLDPASPVNQ